MALLAVAATLLSGCVAPIVAPPVPEGGAEAVAAGGGEEEVLTIRYWQAPTTLNPHQAEGKKDFDAVAVILEPLAHYDATNELVPYLAAEIVSSNTSCERDVEGAKALLAEAGWADSNGDGTVDKDGHEARLVFRTTVNPLRQATQEIVKQNLEEIGIGVELAAVKPTVFFSGDPGNLDSVNRFYANLQMYTATPDSPDPTCFFSDYTCPELTSVANQWQSANFSRFCDPAFDQLFEQFRAELDPAQRDTLAIALNDYLIDNGVVIPLINRDTPAGKAKNLEGLTYCNFGSGIWNINMWRRSE